jgi:glutathione S-transferase
MLKRCGTVTLGFLLAMVIMAAPLEAAAKTKWPTTKPSGEPMLTIYHIEGRRSERIIWYCEEVGLPYKLVFKPGDPQASMELIKQVNPLMAIAPTVQLGDEVMVESAAILQLLQERYAPGKLEPSHDSPDYPKYLQWLHFAEGSAAPRLGTEFLLTSVKGGQMPPVVQSQIGKAAQTLTYMEDYLTRHPYFGGQEFSLADIMMHFNLQFVNVVTHTDMTPYPKLTAWYAKIQERAAFKKMRQVALPNGPVGVP